MLISAEHICLLIRSNQENTALKGIICGLYKVLDIDPNHDFALVSKGLALASLGKHNESIEHFDKVLAIDPNNVVALDNKRLAIEKLG